MNSEPLSVSTPQRATGSRRRTSCSAARTRLWPLPQTGLQFDPARRDVDGAEGMQEEPAAILTAVGHQIDLEEAWPGVVPVGGRATRDLMLEPSPGLRRPASAAGDRPAGPGRQSRQRRKTDPA